jgi:esterase/lipase superfamily enzyme
MPLQGRGTLIALAAAPGRTADDNPSGGNGLFTSHLLRALPTPGITLEELMRQVAREVYRDSAGRQTPELYTSVGEDFELVPRNAHQLDEKFAVMKVFYATDRIKTKEGRFGADPASNDGFTMGLAQVSIPHDHRMGEIEQPTWIRFEFKQDPTEHVVVITMTDQSKAQFYSGLRSVVATSKEKQVLVFIHGFNVGFEDALRRTAQIAYDLKFDGAPVLYSWPSKGVLSPLAYVQDQRNADLSSYHLASFLRELRASSGADSITLIAHSMGNRLLASALNQIFNDKEFAPTTAFRHVALMAPDIDAEQFKRLAEAIKSTAGDITLYCSSRDEALRAAAEYAGYPRAGQGVLIIPGIYTIDASDVDTSLLGAFHQYYADNGAIISDLYYLIRGNSPDQRARLRVRRLGASIYWHFDPASR